MHGADAGAYISVDASVGSDADATTHILAYLTHLAVRYTDKTSSLAFQVDPVHLVLLGLLSSAPGRQQQSTWRSEQALGRDPDCHCSNRSVFGGHFFYLLSHFETRSDIGNQHVVSQVVCKAAECIDCC